MKYTYAFLGQGRTGTTSLWRMLRDHPQIAPSIEKEHYQQSITNLEDYHDGFLIDANTKVLLNGIGNSKKNCLEFAEKMKDERVCCVYVLRNQKERLISYYDMINKVRKRRNVVHEDVFFEDGNVDYIRLQAQILQDIHEYLYLAEIERKIGLENIIVFKMGEIENKQNDLYDFFRIDRVHLKMPKLNTSQAITPTIDTIKDKKHIIDTINNLFNRTVQSIAVQQVDLIHERYNVR